MATEWVIRGVPPGLARDMWWLAVATEGPAGPGSATRPEWGAGARGRAGALVALVALADWLFFGQAIGLSLALFAAAVLGAVMLLQQGRARLRPALMPCGRAAPPQR